MILSPSLVVVRPGQRMRLAREEFDRHSHSAIEGLLKGLGERKPDGEVDQR